MSFPSFRNPADYENYKAIYLQTLQQQINNNANNYNAISLYLKTAQPPVAPTDTRSIEDKFADMIYAQVEVRKLVKTVTDNDTTTNIMDELIKDPPLMIFVLQNFPTIKAYCQKNYAVGIPYPVFMAQVHNKHKHPHKHQHHRQNLFRFLNLQHHPKRKY